MMKLQLVNKQILIFNVNDWETIRKQHKIIGHLLGSNANNFNTLPCNLLYEEALLLIDLNLGMLISSTPSFAEINAKLPNFENHLLKEEKVVYKTNRKMQLDKIKKAIVAAKRLKGDTRTEDDIIDAELIKSCKVKLNNMIWPIPMQPFVSYEATHNLSRDNISKFTTETKYNVFKDLWYKGYYITDGHKFGGDFLVYQGEPLIAHAMYIVRCVEDSNKTISPIEIVAFGRLGTSVRKRSILASIDQNKIVTYVTINWIET